MKRCSRSLVIMDTQIKTIMRHHHTPFRMSKIKTTSNTKSGEHAELLKLSNPAGSLTKCLSHFQAGEDIEGFF